MMGLSVADATLQRWVRRFAHLIENRIRRKKEPINGSMRMDENYIKVKREWKYLYRTVDKESDTIDFLLRYRRNKVEAKAYFKKAFKEIEEKWGRLDFFVHAVAFADKNELRGKYVMTSKENFLNSLNF